MPLEDFLFLITSNQVTSKKTDEKTIFNSQELLEHYPIFTKYSLDIAIKKEDLPLFKIGHKRYFEKEAIDKWISEHNKPIINIRKRK